MNRAAGSIPARVISVIGFVLGGESIVEMHCYGCVTALDAAFYRGLPVATPDAQSRNVHVGRIASPCNRPTDEECPPPRQLRTKHDAAGWACLRKPIPGSSKRCAMAWGRCPATLGCARPRP